MSSVPTTTFPPADGSGSLKRGRSRKKRREGSLDPGELSGTASGASDMDVDDDSLLERSYRSNSGERSSQKADEMDMEENSGPYAPSYSDSEASVEHEVDLESLNSVEDTNSGQQQILSQPQPQPHQQNQSQQQRAPEVGRSRSGRSLKQVRAFEPTMETTIGARKRNARRPAPTSQGASGNSSSTGFGLPFPHYTMPGVVPVFCMMCHKANSPPGNRVILCDSCDAPYHQHCHPIPITNDIAMSGDKWNCWACDLAQGIDGKRGRTAGGKAVNLASPEIPPAKRENGSANSGSGWTKKDTMETAPTFGFFPPLGSSSQPLLPTPLTAFMVPDSNCIICTLSLERKKRGRPPKRNPANSLADLVGSGNDEEEEDEDNEFLDDIKRDEASRDKINRPELWDLVEKRMCGACKADVHKRTERLDKQSSSFLVQLVTSLTVLYPTVRPMIDKSLQPGQSTHIIEQLPHIKSQTNFYPDGRHNMSKGSSSKNSRAHTPVGHRTDRPGSPSPALSPSRSRTKVNASPSMEEVDTSEYDELGDSEADMLRIKSFLESFPRKRGRKPRNVERLYSRVHAWEIKHGIKLLDSETGEDDDDNGSNMLMNDDTFGSDGMEDDIGSSSDEEGMSGSNSSRSKGGPSYEDMVIMAVRAVSDPSGSKFIDHKDILAWMELNYPPPLPPTFKSNVNQALKRSLSRGRLLKLPLRGYVVNEAYVPSPRKGKKTPPAPSPVVGSSPLRNEVAASPSPGVLVQGNTVTYVDHDGNIRTVKKRGRPKKVDPEIAKRQKEEFQKFYKQVTGKDMIDDPTLELLKMANHPAVTESSQLDDNDQMEDDDDDGDYDDDDIYMGDSADAAPTLTSFVNDYSKALPISELTEATNDDISPQSHSLGQNLPPPGHPLLTPNINSNLHQTTFSYPPTTHHLAASPIPSLHPPIPSSTNMEPFHNPITTAPMYHMIQSTMNTSMEAYPMNTQAPPSEMGPTIVHGAPFPQSAQQGQPPSQ